MQLSVTEEAGIVDPVGYDQGHRLVESDPRLLRLPFAGIGHDLGGEVEVAPIEATIDRVRKVASGPSGLGQRPKC